MRARRNQGELTGAWNCWAPVHLGLEKLTGLMAHEWRFVGRDEELELVHRLVTGPESSGAVVTGPAGVGKTRLAQECLAMAREAGMATVQSTATRSAASFPFGALAGALAGDNGHLMATDGWPDLLSRSEAVLANRSQGRRLVLFVDDAHLLDDASATLIHQLAAKGSAFVIVTTCSCASPPAPDPVVALWKEGLAERIELGAMPAPAVEELLTSALGGPVDAKVLMELSARAQGNVLFLREMVLGALEDGALIEDGGTWRLRGRLPLPDRLVELVELRLAGVDPAGRALLELVAFGEPLGGAELDVLSDAGLAERLERRDLLASSMNGRRLEVRLAYSIYGEVLQAGVPVVRERAIARTLAKLVEATGARRCDDALRVASWRLVGGGGQPDMMLAGARCARWRYNFVLAEALARAAVRSGEGFEAALLAAELTGLQGRTQEADRKLAGLAAEATDDAQRAALAVTRIHNSVTWTAQDPLDLLEEARATITEPDWLDRLEAERLVLVELTEGPRAVCEAAAPLLDRATGDALAVACIPAAISLTRSGRLESALDVAERGKAAHRATTHRLAWYPWWHDVSRFLALHASGRLDEAERLAEARYHQAIAKRSAEAQTVFALLPAMAAGERGRVRMAAGRARDALDQARRLGQPVLIRYCHMYGALAFALSGRVEEAEMCLAHLDAMGLPDPADNIDLWLARAWTAVVRGDLSEACRQLETAAAVGDEIGDLIGEAAALHSLARLGRPTEVQDRLADVAKHVEGALVKARVAHTGCLAAQDAARLEDVSKDFEALGADLLAAEAAADAAVTRRRAGEVRAAAGAANRAAALTERCEHPFTPAVLAIGARAMLTAQESETALLAARGLPNRRIANQLCLSVRTVENRLQRVYQKLGITRRTELGRELGLPSQTASH